MPIAKYFKGEGTKVMSDMKQRYGKRGESVFYATANKMKMLPKSKMPKGAELSPKGDIGEHRQEESVRAGGFKDGATVSASKRIK